MTRVASLYLPMLPIERLRRLERPRAQPEKPAPLPLPIDDDPGACSVPRGGGWRPGARWASRPMAGSASVAADAGALPLHQQPSLREMGRRSETAQHPFKAMRPDDGGPRSALIPRLTVVHEQPLILIETVGQRQLIAASCPAALALGLVPGMAATQARALVPDLDVRPIERERDAAVLDRLTRHAVSHWTPAAATYGSDGLRLDLSGTTHLFGGEPAFCRKVLAFLARLGLSARIGVAGTAGAAHALARFGAETIEIVPPGGEVQAIARLPLAALRLTDEALQAAARFGIERIADLLPMPRAPLARRLGRAAIERLDQAIGRIGEPLVPLVITPVPEVRRSLLEPIGTPEVIAQVIGDLIDDMVELLRQAGLGARALSLRLDRVDGAEQQLTIGTARATREARHLKRLLLLKLDRIEPGLGIEGMLLRATRCEPLGAVALTAKLAGDAGPPDVAPLVDQLTGRVGAHAVFRATSLESDVPERAVGRTCRSRCL